MRWEGNRESENVEDRRGDGGSGGGGFPIGGRSIGIGTVVLALIGWGVRHQPTHHHWRSLWWRLASGAAGTCTTTGQ